ncbi:MAG: hypothetical protein CL912_26935 [Deltaproteobacteria bacterium]|nr:hypothetical protein [Deltaproteobacteria bacterium]
MAAERDARTLISLTPPLTWHIHRQGEIPFESPTDRLHLASLGASKLLSRATVVRLSASK